MYVAHAFFNSLNLFFILNCYIEKLPQDLVIVDRFEEIWLELSKSEAEKKDLKKKLEKSEAQKKVLQKKLLLLRTPD